MPNVPFTLISPKRVPVSSEVRMVVVPTRQGDPTVMPDHEPMIETLNPGNIVVADIVRLPTTHEFPTRWPAGRRTPHSGD